MVGIGNVLCESLLSKQLSVPDSSLREKQRFFVIFVVEYFDNVL